MSDKVWKIYLSGEIHSDWREQIENGCAEAGLPVEFAAPITVHESSDDGGVAVSLSLILKKMPPLMGANVA